MALEDLTGSGKYLDDLVESNPVGSTDQVSSLDDHIRGIKNVLKNSFPNVSGAVTATQAELNKLDGLVATTTELNKLSGATASTAELNKLAGLSGDILTTSDEGSGQGIDADTVDGNEASALLDRSNHTGTQTMSTISDAGSLATLDEVPSDHVTNAMLKQPTSGTDYIIGRHPSEVPDNRASALYETTSLRLVCLFDGTIDTSFKLRTTVLGITVYAKLYKNGVAVGAEHTTTSTSYEEQTDSGITVSRGDYLEIYTHGNSALYVKDFQVKSGTDTPFVAVSW